MSTGSGIHTWVEISRSAILQNVEALQSLLSAETTFCAVVSSNAYGHDATLISRTLLDAGVSHFAVNTVDEAIALRFLSSSATIFVMGTIPEERLPEIVQYDLIPNIIDEDALRIIIDAAVQQQKIVRINVEIETGLQQLGVSLRKFHDFCRVIRLAPRSIELVGLSTQLATANEVARGQEYVDQQAEVLREAYDVAVQAELTPTYLHAACSATAILRPELQLTMVRAGIALYGLWPSPELRLAIARGRAFELSPVLCWKTKITQVKDVAAGSSIGYGRTVTTNRPMRVAIIAVGYYDGYDHALSNQGTVLIHGRICPVIGRVSMNMSTVDVSALPHVKIGDTVTLIGRDGMHAIAAEDLAEKIGTMNYELVARINPLNPRLLV